jgi:hypothetical protein
MKPSFIMYHNNTAGTAPALKSVKPAPAEIVRNWF